MHVPCFSLSHAGSMPPLITPLPSSPPHACLLQISPRPAFPASQPAPPGRGLRPPTPSTRTPPGRRRLLLLGLGHPSQGPVALGSVRRSSGAVVVCLCRRAIQVVLAISLAYALVVLFLESPSSSPGRPRHIPRLRSTSPMRR
jgi:hypothetical protein